MASLAHETGRSVGTICGWFQRWGFPTRAQGQRRPVLPSHTKLTDADITSIKRRAAAGEQKASLAREYGISRQRLYTLLAGKHRRLA